MLRLQIAQLLVPLFVSFAIPGATALLPPNTINNTNMAPASSIDRKRSMNKSKKVRIELFFKHHPSELKQRIDWLVQRGGFTAFNLVNKNKDDDLQAWVNCIRECSSDYNKSNTKQNNHSAALDVSVHYSLKYQRVGHRQTPAQHFERLRNFLAETQANEVLLVSGSTKTKNWDSVTALQQLAAAKQKDDMPKSTTIAVAFNPFFPDQAERHAEQERLKAKLVTGLVNKVYFQFGTDIELARQGLEFVRRQIVVNDQDDNDAAASPAPMIPRIAASVFLPTAQLIAQQKFRTWKGVFLSPEYLSGPKSATRLTLDLLRLYAEYENVELLIEAPGVRSEKELELLEQLLSFQQNEEPKDDNKNDAFPHQENDVSKKASPNNEAARQATSESSNSVSPGPLVDEEALRRPAIVLFGSHDVRWYDNSAVHAAAHHSEIVPVFLWNPLVGQWGARGALQVVLKEALRNLSKDLQSQFGLSLICRDTSDIVEDLVLISRETGAGSVYWNREFTPESRVLESKITKALNDLNVQGIPCVSSLLYDIEKLELGKGFQSGHWGTLMPFLKTCQKQLGTPRRQIPCEATASLLRAAKGLSSAPEAVSVDDLEIAVMPPKTKWDAAILERFPISTAAANSRLEHFFATGFSRYEKERSRADNDESTSQLSMYLRIGLLSPNELFWKTAESELPHEEKKTFSRRLYWRDLAYFQLLNFPSMRERSIREHYDETEWVSGEEHSRRFDAWKRGMTGYPIVDAGMRELYITGWMTQSVRMVVASFLTEYLRVNWVHGADWFHDTLIDADSAINAMMWQNAGRSGIDQWNFVLSPENASQDPSGSYTRTWVPELSKLPNKYLHQPWKLSDEELATHVVVLGKTYPHRVIQDLKAERTISVTNVLNMRRKNQHANDKSGYDLVTLPNGDETVVFTKKEYRLDRQGNVMSSSTQPKSRKPKSSPGRPRKRGRQQR